MKTNDKLNLNDDDSLRQSVSRTLSLRAAAIRRSKHSTGWNVPPFRAASGQVVDLESCSALGEPTAKPIRAAFRTLGDDNIRLRATPIGAA